MKLLQKKTSRQSLGNDVQQNTSSIMSHKKKVDCKESKEGTISTKPTEIADSYCIISPTRSPCAMHSKLTIKDKKKRPNDMLKSEDRQKALIFVFVLST